MKRILLKLLQMSPLSRYKTMQTNPPFALDCRVCQKIPVQTVLQIYSARDLEDNLNKIREICSDDKHDWDQRASAVSRRCSPSIDRFSSYWSFFFCVDFYRWRRSAPCWWRVQLATTVSTSTYDCWTEPSSCQLKTCAHKWSERPASLSRESRCFFTFISIKIAFFWFVIICVFTLSLCSHLSSVLGNKFDHGAEGIVPVLFNLIPNCAKVMATSGVSAIRIIIRVSFIKSFVLSHISEALASLFFTLLCAAHSRSQTHPAYSQQLHIQVCGCPEVRGCIMLWYIKSYSWKEMETNAFFFF